MKRFGINIAVVLLAVYLIPFSESLFKPINIKCKTYDKSFSDFTQCELKVLGRGKVGVFIYMKIHQLPITKLYINLSLQRKFNGFKPFLYNVTVDFCDFILHKKRYPWFAIVHDTLSNSTNVNHSCPYNHDIIVSNLVPNDDFLKKTPFPTGAYMYQLLFGNPKWQNSIQVMFDIVEIEASNILYG